MGEGCTPLLARTLHGAPVLLKCEWFMPTGSFKDRGASVMLSLLRAQGVRAVLEDSSGNGGAAVAAYAAAGGMQATIMAPASTSPAKTVQMRAHGATVELIPGSRQDTADAAVAPVGERLLRQPQLASVLPARHQDAGLRAVGGPWLPARRTTSSHRCGAGSNVLGCQIGFSELLRAGEIECLPRIFAAQPANCAPIAAAFMAQSDVPVPTTIAPTMAEGTARITRPASLMRCR